MLSFPYKILIEAGAVNRLAEFLDELRAGQSCAIVCAKEINNLINLESNIGDFEHGIFEPESISEEFCKKLSQQIDAFDFVIGIGGGKAIDTAKYSAFLAKKPWVSFPTIPSHDGIVSSRASLEASGKKISIAATEPIGIISDTSIVQQAPYRFIAAGAGDVLSNISAIEDWRLATKKTKEDYNTIVAELSLIATKAVIENVSYIKNQKERGMRILLWALIASGFAMNMHGSSRPASGSEHNFSHALDQLGSTALHGEQVALGTIISTYLQGGDWKKIVDIMIDLHLPTSASEIKLSEDVIVKALLEAPKIRDRYTILNEIKLDESRCKEILTELGII